MKHTYAWRSAILSAFAILFSAAAYSQAPQVNSDYWTATDALGRKTTNFSEAGKTREYKYGRFQACIEYQGDP